MNNIKSDKLKSRFFNFIIAFGIGVLFLCNSCEESILNETPLSSLSPDKVLTTKDGFELFITSLHQAARDELTIEDLSTYFDMSIGTDIATTGQEPAVNYRNYGTYLIPTNPTILRYWDWAYK
jgi:starch-binding outer membrane protein, SusD/RagB family